MATTYFKLPSFSRGEKRNDGEDENATKSPVLNTADEKFLVSVASSRPVTHIPTTVISDNGTQAETDESSRDGVVILPGKQPSQSVSAEDTSSDKVSTQHSPAANKPPDPLNELPSQEEAEAATKGFQTGALTQTDQADSKAKWTSYLPSLPSVTTSRPSSGKPEDGRTWKEYAQSYIPDLPALPASWTKSNAKAEIVYKDDGTVDEEATKAKQEKDVAALLSNLSLETVNNHVFAISKESQKFFDRFVQVLKDVVNGVPTAYEDMEKLMKEAGPTIEKQWNAMPPFVQTLVKALPAKLSASLAPGLLAAAGEKPSVADTQKKGSAKKSKRRFKIPGMKSLVKKQGLAAGILRNIVIFFETRFPFLISTTNIAMSLSVFSKSCRD